MFIEFVTYRFVVKKNLSDIRTTEGLLASFDARLDLIFDLNQRASTPA